jgi:RimJ/RimL family protein N-acetyltransferase
LLSYQDIALRTPKVSEAQNLYDTMTKDEQWTKFNGPYFGYRRPSYEDFLTGPFQRLRKGKDALAIEFEGRLVGTVTYYWEDQNTRWLEAGIVLFDKTVWSKGIGRTALIPWVTHIFSTIELERVGLTTWSGNPRMVKCAQAIGFQVEGVLRKVRYYQGEYYDSIKLGVTRHEWQTQYGPLNQ